MTAPPADRARGCKPCPLCGRAGRVLETRSAPGATRRRYRCPDCGGRWSTLEEVVWIDPAGRAVGGPRHRPFARREAEVGEDPRRWGVWA